MAEFTDFRVIKFSNFITGPLTFTYCTSQRYPLTEYTNTPFFMEMLLNQSMKDQHTKLLKLTKNKTHFRCSSHEPQNVVKSQPIHSRGTQDPLSRYSRTHKSVVQWVNRVVEFGNNNRLYCMHLFTSWGQFHSHSLLIGRSVHERTWTVYCVCVCVVARNRTTVTFSASDLWIPH